jgi:hypothetical protein
LQKNSASTVKPNLPDRCWKSFAGMKYAFNFDNKDPGGENLPFAVSILFQKEMP